MAEQGTTWAASVKAAKLASLKTMEGKFETAWASFDQIPPEGKNAKGKTLDDFCHDAGIEVGTCQNYRSIVLWWQGDPHRPVRIQMPSVSWDALRAARPRYESGDAFREWLSTQGKPQSKSGRWTVDELREKWGLEQTNTGRQQQTQRSGWTDDIGNGVNGDGMHEAERQAALVRDALTDPKYMTKLAHEHPEQALQVLRATANIGDVLQEEAEKRFRKSYPGLAHVEDWVAAGKAITKARRELNKALDIMLHHEMTAETRYDFRQQLATVETSLGWCVSYLESGNKSFENELDEILQEG